MGGTNCGTIMINHEYMKHLPKKIITGQHWNIVLGSFKTNSLCKITFKPSQFYKNRAIVWKIHVDKFPFQKNTYGMIIGRDFLH